MADLSHCESHDCWSVIGTCLSCGEYTEKSCRFELVWPKYLLLLAVEAKLEFFCALLTFAVVINNAKKTEYLGSLNVVGFLVNCIVVMEPFLITAC